LRLTGDGGGRGGPGVGIGGRHRHRVVAALARRLGRPNAVWEISDEVWELAQKPLIPTNRRNIFIDFSRRVPMRSRRF